MGTGNRVMFVGKVMCRTMTRGRKSRGEDTPMISCLQYVYLRIGIQDVQMPCDCMLLATLILYTWVLLLDLGSRR